MDTEYTLEVWDEVRGLWIVSDSSTTNTFDTAPHFCWRVIRTEVVAKSDIQPIGY